MIIFPPFPFSSVSATMVSGVFLGLISLVIVMSPPTIAIVLLFVKLESSILISSPPVMV